MAKREQTVKVNAKRPTGGAAHRKAKDVDVDRTEITGLYLQGLTFRRIRDRLLETRGTTYSLQTIFKVVQLQREEWKVQRAEMMDAYVAEELEKIAMVEAEAWAAWLRSCQRETVTVTRRRGTPGQRPEGGGEAPIRTTEVETRTEERQLVGDPRFLAVLDKCGDRRARLLGLYKQPSGGEDGGQGRTGGDGNDIFTQNTTFVIVGGAKPLISSEADLPDE